MAAILNGTGELPAGIIESDLIAPWRGIDSESEQLTDEAEQYLSEIELYGKSLTFYRTTAFGWVLCTLDISKGKAGREKRTYAIGCVDGKQYRVGGGPHVQKKIEVYIKASNYERVSKFVELWLQGMEGSGAIRDRISSRRAQGQLHRAAGRSSWTW